MPSTLQDDGEERLNLAVAEDLRDPDDRLLWGERDEGQRSRRGQRPPRALLIRGVAPVLGGEELDRSP